MKYDEYTKDGDRVVVVHKGGGCFRSFVIVALSALAVMWWVSTQGDSSRGRGETRNAGLYSPRASDIELCVITASRAGEVSSYRYKAELGGYRTGNDLHCPARVIGESTMVTIKAHLVCSATVQDRYCVTIQGIAATDGRVLFGR